MVRTLMAVIVGIASIVSAQATEKTIVSPVEYADKIGNIFGELIGYPFTLQQIHDDLKGAQRTIVKISLRNDIREALPTIKVPVTLIVSETGRPSSHACSVFHENHGTSVSMVIDNVVVDLPKSYREGNRFPFTYEFPFSGKPFTYSGKGNLCWELWIHPWAMASFQPNFFVGPDCNPTRFGRGCTNSIWPRPSSWIWVSQGSALPAWSVRVFASDLAAYSQIVWWIGTSDKAWGAIPLPLDLAPYGGNGCHLYTEPFYAQFARADSFGNYGNRASPLTIPIVPAIRGMPLFFQAACLDCDNNSFPFAFTDCATCLIPRITYPSSSVIQVGVNAWTGIVSIGYAAITKFTYY